MESSPLPVRSLPIHINTVGVTVLIHHISLAANVQCPYLLLFIRQILEVLITLLGDMHTMPDAPDLGLMEDRSIWHHRPRNHHIMELLHLSLQACAASNLLYTVLGPEQQAQRATIRVIT